MRLTWHILHKDLKRLWWEALVTVMLVFAVARMDLNRYDFIPSALEGILHLVLPAAWAYLIALAVQQDPLVGTRQFWITRPYSRWALAMEKLVFAILCVHVPALIAATAVIAGRGFAPADAIGTLAWKQFLILILVTLPSWALASITRNITQFLAAATATGIAAAMIANVVEAQFVPWVPAQLLRNVMAFSPIVITSIFILIWQYRTRRALAAQAAASVAIAGAGLLLAYVPREFGSVADCLNNRAAGAVNIRLKAEAVVYPDPQKGPPRMNTFEVPIEVIGIPARVRPFFESIDFTLASERGGNWKTPHAPSGERPFPFDSVRGHVVTAGSRDYLSVFVPRSIHEHISPGKVTLSGRSAVRLYQAGNSGSIPVAPEMTSVPGFGRCGAFIQANFDGRDLLKVVCESTGTSPFHAGVRLIRSSDGRAWAHRLGDPMNHVPYPMRTWLSPITRRQTFFHLVEEEISDLGSRWMAPRSSLEDARIVITPDRAIGCTLVSYQLRDVMLTR